MSSEERSAAQGHECPRCESIEHTGPCFAPPRQSASAAQDRREVVIRAARLACATYPHTEAAPRSDIDYYMAQLRDELALLDNDCRKD